MEPNQHQMGGWNPYMYGMQSAPPPGWYPNGMMMQAPNAAPIPMQPPHMQPHLQATNAPMPMQPPYMQPHLQPMLNMHAADDQPIDDEVEEVVPPGGQRDATKIKLSNFAPEEDVNIVKSWLEISCDPIVNTGQKKDNFWDRVSKQYNERRGAYLERSLRSVTSRWDRIKQQASKFAGYVAAAYRDNVSGTLDADKTTIAVSTFAKVEKYKFQFMHCWDLLKDEPKWQDMKQKGARSVANDTIGDNIPQVPPTVDLDVDDDSPSAARKRPIGRDAAKARKKKCSSATTSSSEYTSKLQDLSLQKMTMWQEENSRKVDRFDHLASIEEKRFEEIREHNKSILELEQQKINIMRDKLDMQMEDRERERLEKEKAEDERILKVDLDSCTPDLRMYYEACREEILQKVIARRLRNRQM